SLGCQNVYYEEKGAFTGETSVLMIKNYCKYVLVGHSERRHIFGETTADTEKKIALVLKHGLVPVLCVGETLAEREAGKHKEVVAEQLEAAKNNLPEYHDAVIVAYEPVWAIGTGKTATPEDAQEMHAFIKSRIQKKTIVLYGGSVKPENAAELLSQADIDGVLVGGASLNPDSFLQIIAKGRQEK
ncbi:triose-phosphate isomerase, partial [Candidatus Woesearchaeota archaeon]